MVEGHDRASRVADRASDPDADFDALSDVLRTVRLRAAVFFVWEASSPFATPVPAGERFAPVLLPDARQIVSYHVVVEGACWGSLIGGPPLRLHAGDVLLIPRGDPYVIASSEEECRTQLVEETAIEFFRAMAAGELPFVIADGGGGPDRARVVCGFLGCDVRPFNPVVAALPAIVRLGPRAGPGDDRLRTLADYAVAEASRPGPGSGGILTRLGELMFMEVVRRCLVELPDAPRGWPAGFRDSVVARCLAVMHRRPAYAWTLERLAKAVAVSRSGLAERFAEKIGEPPIQYLTRWRLQLATNLLGEDTLKVESIARRVGYASGPAFSRAFKRVVGVTPTEWRQADC